MNLKGTLRGIDETTGAVRVEDVYDTDIDDLWQACTTPERLARWIGEVSGDLRVGGVIKASWTSSWRGDGRVEVCEPPRHLMITLAPGTDEQTEVEAWLSEEADRTRLVVEERGLPRGQLHFYGSGWQAHLEDLGRSLSGLPSVWHARWTELTPAYERLAVN